ncbi:MAG: hypothetical protein ACI9TV_003129 [Sulfurimonas sp.]|jgi:hypothetical protein|uniref:hypothetical protein n=1 Tax=Sulfurimonas sp. TaxID=2022749 RepID=UPI0039E26BFE
MYKKKVKTTHVCITCTSYVNPVVKKQGFFLIEIIIWILALFLMPSTAGTSIFIAVSYSVFRLLSKKIVCPKCRSTDIVINDTPAAQEIIQERNALRR